MVMTAVMTSGEWEEDTKIEMKSKEKLKRIGQRRATRQLANDAKSGKQVIGCVARADKEEVDGAAKRERKIKKRIKQAAAECGQQGGRSLNNGEHRHASRKEKDLRDQGHTHACTAENIPPKWSDAVVVAADDERRRRGGVKDAIRCVAPNRGNGSRMNESKEKGLDKGGGGRRWE